MILSKSVIRLSTTSSSSLFVIKSLIVLNNMSESLSTDYHLATNTSEEV